MSTAVTPLGELVRRWRQAQGLSQPQLARALGVSQQALQQLEAGETRQPRYLVRLARLMQADAEALAEGRIEPRLPGGEAASQPLPGAPSAASAAVSSNVAMPQAAPFGQRDLPVYASAQGGPDGMIVSYEPIEWLERPAPLAGVPNAFAMYVVNDSMEPRYHQGDLLLIHPQRPVRRGEDVLVIKTGAGEEHHAFVKQLMALDERRILLRQLNPERTFEIARAEVAGLHLVVGVYYGGRGSA